MAGPNGAGSTTKENFHQAVRVADRGWNGLCGLVKVSRFALLGFAATVTLGGNKLPLGRIRELCKTGHIGLLALHAPLTFLKSVDTDVNYDEKGKPSRELSQWFSKCLAVSDVAILVLFANSKRAFLSKVNIAQMERVLYGSFVAGASAGFLGELKNGNAKSRVLTTVLLAYALAETTSWYKGCDHVFSLMGKQCSLWKIRTVTGVASGLSSLGLAIFPGKDPVKVNAKREEAEEHRFRTAVNTLSDRLAVQRTEERIKGVHLVDRLAQQVQESQQEVDQLAQRLRQAQNQLLAHDTAAAAAAAADDGDAAAADDGNAAAGGGGAAAAGDNA